MKDKKREEGKKGAIELEMLAWWLIAIFILIIIVVAYFILSGKGQAIIGHIKNLIRFGG